MVVILFLLFSSSKGCSEVCSACSKVSNVWVWNTFSDKWCELGDASCNNNCGNCSIESSRNFTSAQKCDLEKVTCGKESLFNRKSGSFKLESVKSQKVCGWVLDLRNILEQGDFLNVSVEFSNSVRVI